MRLTRRALTGGLTLGLATTSLAGGRAWSAEPLTPEPAVIRGEAKAGGRTVAYRAVAAETVLPGPDGAPEATLFSTAYFAEGEDAAARPVTFFFNGGPGAATIDLREGLAPVHTRNAAGRGFRLADNPDTLIAASDLVFVDPGGIGYSRFLTPGVAARYWGVDEDARAVADFIAIWLKANGREAAPKYLVGESYAGIRVGMVAERMARQAAFLESRSDFLAAPMGERVEADAAIGGLDGFEPAAFAAVIALATGDPGVETAKRALERQDFTQIATQIRVALPQRAVRVVTGEVEGNWFDGAHVAQAQAAYQYAAVGKGVVK